MKPRHLHPDFLAHTSIRTGRLISMILAIFVAGIMRHVGAEDLVRSMIGMNLSFYAEWGPGQVVVDLMRQARPFGTPQRYWDYGTAPHDELGWPTGDAGTIFAMSDHAGVIQLGTYKLSFSGKATIASVDGRVTVENNLYDETLDATTADVVVTSGANVIGLIFTNTDGGIRNVKLIRPGYEESDLVIDEFINAIKPFSVLRMLNWQLDFQYAAPWVTEWSDERQSDYATFTGGGPDGPKKPGVSKAFQIAVANRTMKDIWIHLPLFCSDDYIRELATLVRDSLNPNLRIYIEICNEVWNAAWPYNTATGANREAALAEAAEYNYAFDGNSNQWNSIAPRRIARRMTEHAKIFAEVLGSDQVPSRVRPVLAWQTGTPAFEAMLSYVVHRFGADAPEKYIYAVSSAPYFTGNDFATLQNYSTTVNPKNNLQIITTAKKYGVQAIAYEGGPHIASVGGQTPEMQASITMGDLIYSDLKNNWFDQGGGLFCYFMLATVWVNGHIWGATQNLTELDGPKYQALLRLSNELPKETAPIVQVAPRKNGAQRQTAARILPASSRHLYDILGRRIATGFSRIQKGEFPSGLVLVQSAGTVSILHTVSGKSHTGKVNR